MVLFTQFQHQKISIINMQQGLKFITVGFCFQFIPFFLYRVFLNYIPKNFSLPTTILVLLTFLIGYYLVIQGCSIYCKSKGYSSRWSWLGLFNVFILPFFFLLKNKSENNIKTVILEAEKFNQLNFIEIILSVFSIGLSMSFTFGLIAYLAVGQEKYYTVIEHLAFLNFMLLIIVFYVLFFIVKYISDSKLNWKYIIGLKNSLNYLDMILLALFYSLFLRGFNRLFFYYLSFQFPNHVENYLNQNNYDSLLSNILYSISSLIFLILLELIFNFIVLHKISLKKGIVTGLLISSLVCSFLAFETFVTFFVYRIIVGILYIKTKNIISAIVYGFLVIFFDCIYGFYYNLKSDPNDFVSLSEYQKIAEASLSYRFLFIAISLPYLIYFIYKNWPRNNQVLPYFANEQKSLN